MYFYRLYKHSVVWNVTDIHLQMKTSVNWWWRHGRLPVAAVPLVQVLPNQHLPSLKCRMYASEIFLITRLKVFINHNNKYESVVSTAFSFRFICNHDSSHHWVLWKLSLCYKGCGIIKIDAWKFYQPQCGILVNNFANTYCIVTNIYLKIW